MSVNYKNLLSKYAGFVERMTGRQVVPLASDFTDSDPSLFSSQEVAAIMAAYLACRSRAHRAAELEVEYRGIGPHPTFSTKEWSDDVVLSKTRLGYWEWCAEREFHAAELAAEAESDVSSPRGAPMGRPDEGEFTSHGKIHMNCLNIDDQGYDAGGAYWGVGDPVFCAAQQVGGGVTKRYVRAKSVHDAIDKLGLIERDGGVYSEE